MSEEKIISFAEAMFMRTIVGTECEPARLTPRVKVLLLDMLSEDLSNTAVTFEDNDAGFERFMLFSSWLKERLAGGRARPTLEVASVIRQWLQDNRNSHYSAEGEYGEECYGRACQWLTYQWNRWYSYDSVTRWWMNQSSDKKI